MKKLLVLSTMTFGLAGCVTGVPSELKTELGDIQRIMKEDPATVCKVLVNDHEGWEQNGSTCEKRFQM